jgi:TRAP-type C4-dicarboxylate transport system permease small subunit
MPWKKLTRNMEARHSRLASKIFLIFALVFGTAVVYVGYNVMKYSGNLELLKDWISLGDVTGLVVITFTCLMLAAMMDVKADVLELKEKYVKK